MKTLSLGLRKCQGCGALMSRPRYANGRLEHPHRFVTRKYCGDACKGRGYLLAAKNPTGKCKHCSEELKRKRFACGRWEERKAFRKRRYCDNACKLAWIDAPLGLIAYGQEMRERSKRSGRGKRPVLVCFHGSTSLRRCSYCSEIARVTGASRRQMMRRRPAWRELWS